MRYEESPRNSKLSLGRILTVVNFLLVLVIAFCFNQIVVNLLFR